MNSMNLFFAMDCIVMAFASVVLVLEILYEFFYLIDLIRRKLGKNLHGDG